MIQFNYTGSPYPSFQRRQEDKAAFLENLGPFKEEFDAKDGVVTFDYSYPPTDERKTTFGLRNGELTNFTLSWNEYLGGLERDAS